MSSAVIARPTPAINLRAFAIVVTVAVAVVYLLTYITTYSDNAPWWDEWDISLNVVVNTLDGSLSLEQLFAQHNSHRIAPTNVLTAINAILFRWELRFEILFNAALTILSLWIVASLSRWSVIVTIGAAMLMFSPRLDWLWAFNSQSHFALFFMLCTIWFLQRGQRVYIWAAMITGIAATYSFGYGVVIWPVGWVLVLVTGSRRSHLVLWSVASIAILLLYVLTFRSVESSVATLGNTLLFVPRYLGIAFFPGYRQFLSPAFVLGVIGIVLATFNVIALWRNQSLDLSWLVLAGLSVGIGVLISFGRGPDSALNGRYGIIGNLFWVAYLAFLGSLFTLRGHRMLKQTNILFVGVLVGVFFYCQQAYWLEEPTDRTICITDLSRGCLDSLHPHPELILDNIEQMRELRLGIFR